MTVERGEVWLADLNPTRGSEQGGTRPVIVFQNEIISQFSTTVITIGNCHSWYCDLPEVR